MQVAYKTALAAVFIEGFIFVFLAVTGVRTRIIRAIPKSVMLATSAGIGLYLAHIGLQKSEGLNVVTYDSATIVTLGRSSMLSDAQVVFSLSCTMLKDNKKTSLRREAFQPMPRGMLDGIPWIDRRGPIPQCWKTSVYKR